MAKITASKGAKIATPKATKVAISSSPKVKPVGARVNRVTTKKSSPTIKKGRATIVTHSMPRTKQLAKKQQTIKNKTPSTAYLRRKAVTQAWKHESQLVKKIGQGTRDWNKGQLNRIARGEKIKGYEGHHIRDVSSHSKKWAGDPRNIQFLTRKEHLNAHKGNFRTPTTGKLIDRQKMMRQNHIIRQSPKK